MFYNKKLIGKSHARSKNAKVPSGEDLVRMDSSDIEKKYISHYLPTSSSFEDEEMDEEAMKIRRRDGLDSDSYEYAARNKPYGSNSQDSFVKELTSTSDTDHAGKSAFMDMFSKAMDGLNVGLQSCKFEEGWHVNTFAGAGEYAGGGFGDADGKSKRARFRSPKGIATSPITGDLLVAEAEGHRIRKINPNGEVSTVAGSHSAEPGYVDGWCSSARFHTPVATAVDSKGRIFISDFQNNCIRQIYKGVVSTIVKHDRPEMQSIKKRVPVGRLVPKGLTVDSYDNLYFVDALTATVRKRTPKGKITVVGGRGMNGDKDGPLGYNELCDPHALSCDQMGNLYVTCAPVSNFKGAIYGHRIRKISPDGIMSTYPFSKSQQLLFPEGLLATGDRDLSVIVADSANHIIRRVLPVGERENVNNLTPPPTSFIQEDDKESNSDEIYKNHSRRLQPEDMASRITEIAGSSQADYGFKQGLGSNAMFYGPAQLCRSLDGTSLFVADCFNNRVRKLWFQKPQKIHTER